MPKLVQIRQHIATVETIKKVTHAMRLISMSAHSRMRNQQEPLSIYTNAISSLFARVLQYAPTWTHPVINPPQNGKPHALLIVVGSQKSWCGTFNAGIISTVKKHLREHPDAQYDIVIIGKRMIDLAKEANIPMQNSYEQFSQRHLSTLTDIISNMLLQANPAYRSATIISNYNKSFFAQKPQATSLVPFTMPAATDLSKKEAENDYVWAHTPEIILSQLINQYLEARIYHTLFESLLAEYAARFISMDSSTRNAQSLLDKAKSEYNKLRQAKITKELNALSSSYSS